MKLILHASDANNPLSGYYQRAFASAVELFIVVAYLTDWDKTRTLNSACKKFRIIIGRDFGITRRSACEAVMQWLPSKRKGQFLVADSIGGFHPKAVFWKEENGKAFAIVGSSNLTRAAFATNYEANVYGPLTRSEYAAAKNWVDRIERQSVVVSEDWLRNYKEAPMGRLSARTSAQLRRRSGKPTPVVAFKLPTPRGATAQIKRRRAAMAQYAKHRLRLMQLFRRCADGKTSSKAFFEQLPTHWSAEAGDRLQGKGWERLGKRSDFQKLAASFVKIVDAPNADRDDIVVEQIDYLHDEGVPARKAFLSEMLCLRFPKEYPVLNAPVINYVRHVRFKPPRGASEGVRYVDLAKKLRSSLDQNPDHPAKNIAELDAVIWLAFGRKR